MEEYVEDQKDFWFPKNNKSIKQLGEMTTQEQIQVIELGLMTKVISIEAAKRIVNGENELNKDNMANMYQTQINELETNNKEKDRRIAQIQQRHLNDRENDRQEIRKKQRQIFEDEIKELKYRNDNLEINAASFHNKEIKLIKNFHEKITNVKDEAERKSNNQRNAYEKKLEEERKKVENFNRINENSAEKGKEGENWVFNQLHRFFTSAMIDPVKGTGHKGDFHVIEQERIGMFESKNYKGNVPKKEVDKFYNDMEKNDQLNYGIFLSLKSGVVNREDLHLEFVMGKPIVFVHNAREHPYKIMLAYKVCQLILKNMDCIDVKKEEVQHKLQTYFKSMKMIITKLHTTLNNFGTDMKKQLDDAWVNIEQLFQLLNIEQ